jgi:WD40 repeat protein
MKFNRLTPGLIGLVALLSILLGCGTTRKITVHCDPAGAELSIDGHEVGVTPTTQELKFDDKKTSFELEVKKPPEFESVRRTIHEHEAKGAPDPWLLFFTLEPLISVVNVQVSSFPEGASVSVNNGKPATAPATIPVEFTRPSPQSPWSAPKAVFSLQNHESQTIDLSYESVVKNPAIPAVYLEPVRKEMWITVKANVEGANVEIDGQPLGKGPLSHRFIFTRTDGSSSWNTIRVEVHKDGYEYVSPEKKAQPSFVQTLNVQDAERLSNRELHVELKRVEFVNNLVKEWVMSSSGLRIAEKKQMSQVREVEKEPKARSVTRITDVNSSNSFVESRISVMSDGEQIIYSLPVRAPGKEEPTGANIWIRRGRANTRMTDGNYFDFDPFVTPDGKWIYFSSNRLGRINIWRMQTQGKGGLTKITDSPSSLADMEVSVSPNGDKIAYTTLLIGANVRQIWLANMDGTLPTQIRTGKSPAWSPDGKKIAFVAPDPVSNRDKIWVMDSDGGNPTQITDGTASDDRYPVWYPAGEYIIYASNRAYNEANPPEQQFDIWIMRADGTGHTQITVNGSYDSRPEISRDGKYIYFFSNRGAKKANQDTLQIWRIEF